MVIPPHEGAAKAGRWDGAENKARVRSPSEPDYFARIFAFRDSGKDAALKTSYRFIHHFVGEDGDAGEASEMACRNGIAVLNGARGGTTLRGEDRAGVYAHLARHLRDAGIEPPELASAERLSMLSRRVGGATLEIRSGGNVRILPVKRAEKKGAALAGYAAVYDSQSVDLGGWREIIARGAFDESVEAAATRPIKSFWNHNSDIVLGSTDAGTLVLESDERGLSALLMPPEWARPYVETIQRGDVKQMSIGFVVRSQEWREGPSGDLLRVVRKADLWEVSPVAFPAYPETSITAEADAGGERGAPAALHRRKLQLMELLRR